MTRPFSSGPRGERGIRERIGGNGKAGEAEARAAFARAAGRSDRGGNVAGLVADKRAWLRTGDPLARGPRRRGVVIGLNLAGRAVDRTKAAVRKLGKRLDVVRGRGTPERRGPREAAARARREDREHERRPSPGQELQRRGVAPREEGGGGGMVLGYRVRMQAVPVGADAREHHRERGHGAAER